MAAPKLVRSVLTIVACIILGSTSIDAETWCVITNSATPIQLQPNLDYACSHGADCGPIQPGGKCFAENSIYVRSAYAYNSYYIHQQKIRSACYFGGTAQIIFTDPSDGVCIFPSSLESINEGTNTTMVDSPLNNSKLKSSKGVRKLGQSNTQ